MQLNEEYRRAVTCGPLFEVLREKMIGLQEPESEVRKAWAAGFIAGEAEKVYLGAANAAMFRPSSDGFKRHLDNANLAAEVYRLTVVTYTYFDDFDKKLKNEIWILRNASLMRTIEKIKATPVNSSEWHTLRAFLCGIPFFEIDPDFHTRRNNDKDINDKNEERRVCSKCGDTNVIYGITSGYFCNNCGASDSDE